MFEKFDWGKRNIQFAFSTEIIINIIVFINLMFRKPIIWLQ